VGTEFDSGLRAHLERGERSVAEPAPGEGDPEPQPIEPQAAAVERDPQPQRVAPRGDVDGRIEALKAAEAEPAFRERRIADREAEFNVAVQRVVYELASAIVDGTVAGLPQDELARPRARRGGFTA
jgi:hypothetical protein